MISFFVSLFFLLILILVLISGLSRCGDEERGREKDKWDGLVASEGVAARRFGRLLAVDGEEMDLKDEIAVGRNLVAGRVRAVRKVGGDGQLGLLAQAHRKDALVPSTDDLSDANHELEGLLAVVAAVKLGAVAAQRAEVVHRQRVPGLGERCLVSRLQNFLVDAHLLLSTSSLLLVGKKMRLKMKT